MPKPALEFPYSDLFQTSVIAINTGADDHIHNPPMAAPFQPPQPPMSIADQRRNGRTQRATSLIHSPIHIVFPPVWMRNKPSGCTIGFIRCDLLSTRASPLRVTLHWSLTLLAVVLMSLLRTSSSRSRGHEFEHPTRCFGLEL